MHRQLFDRMINEIHFQTKVYLNAATFYRLANLKSFIVLSLLFMIRMDLFYST